jgi:hypothetical protein
MWDFAHPGPAPSRFAYTSGDSRYSEYGWRVAMHRAERGFSTLSTRGSQGFSLSGDGSATVVTPPEYRPGARYTVGLAGDWVARRTLLLTAAPDGRLTIDVLLGRGDRHN